MTTEATTGSSDSAEGEVSGSGFVNVDAQNDCAAPCAPWDGYDCPAGQTCTVVSCESNSPYYSEFGCVDVMGDDAVGEPCTVLGDKWDGADTCEAGALCWGVDEETGVGICAEHCTGSINAPLCPADHHCWTAGQDLLPAVCGANCDLLAQDCSAGFACRTDWIGAAACLPAVPDPLDYGEPCSSAGACARGLLCISSELVPEPECAAENGCCSPMCDLLAPAPCPGAGQNCEPMFEPGSEPFGQENVGVCAVPEGP